MGNVDWRDVAARAAKTAVQAGVAAFGAAMTGLWGDAEGLRAALAAAAVAGIGAALSAAWNSVAQAFGEAAPQEPLADISEAL